MRNYFKTMLFLILLFFSFKIQAQMVKIVDDIDKLDSNKTCFVGKTVKNLLSEIKPEIKMVKLLPGISKHRTSSLTFMFIPITEYTKYENKHNGQPPYIRVIVNKNDFEYNWNGLEWTKEMADKFSDYVVLDIRVYKGVMSK